MANLAGGEVVDAILKGVDLVDAGDFGLVEVFCRGFVLVSNCKDEKRERGG